MQAIALLDGGSGQEVYKRSGKPAHPLWSAQVMLEAPEIVEQVHEDFIKAGARILTINSYAATPSRLARDGRAEWFEKLQQQALDLAHNARNHTAAPEREVQIAGCLPPLTGSYVSDQRPYAELLQEYDQIVAIQSPQVDLFIAETLSTIKEAQAAAEAVTKSGKPLLLSFTLSDKNPALLRSGEKRGAAVNEMAGSGIAGLLFNCSFPESITAGIAALRHLDIPFGGYANGFTSVEALKAGGRVDVLESRHDLDEEIYARHILQWVRMGARIVGGCCEVGPSYIEHLHQQLSGAGFVPGNLKASGWN